MAKVFLFNPPAVDRHGFIREGRCTQRAGVWTTHWQPISLLTCATILERDGHQVDVIDFSALKLGINSFKEIIKRRKPDFAIWSVGTPTIHFDLAISGIIKAISPETITAVMGTHVSVIPEVALNLSSIDLVIRREPEQIVRELCQSKDRKWKSIQGISYRKSRGEFHHNKDYPFMVPEEIPSPAWHYLNLRPYNLPLKGRPFLMIAPIRGCPYPCSFCTAPIYYGKKLRKRPIVHVLDEIERNIREFKMKDFFVWADTFTADREYVVQFCQGIIKRSLHISWTCNSRVDTVDRELLALMKEAGLWMISFGIESGSDRILERIKKKTTVSQSKRAVLTAHELGIKTSGHFIFGFPGESYETMEETLTLAMDLPLDVAQFYVAAPFPGTDLYREALEKNWLKRDSTISQDRAGMRIPGLSPELVERFRLMAYRRFYLRPKVFFNLLSLVNFSPDAIKPIFPGMWRFLGWIKGIS